MNVQTVLTCVKMEELVRTLTETILVNVSKDIMDGTAFQVSYIRNYTTWNLFTNI